MPQRFERVIAYSPRCFGSEAVSPIGPSQPVADFRFRPPANVWKMGQAAVPDHVQGIFFDDGPQTEAPLFVVLKASAKPVLHPFWCLHARAMAYDFSIAKDLHHCLAVFDTKVSKDQPSELL